MAGATHTLRVNQLDALRVDEELLLLLQQEVGAALQHILPASTGKYSRELQLLLQFFFFCSHALRNKPTPGATLQNVRYARSSTTSGNASAAGSSSSGNSTSSAARPTSLGHGLGSSSSEGSRTQDRSGCSTAGPLRDSSSSNDDNDAGRAAADDAAAKMGQRQQHLNQQRLHQQQLQQRVGGPRSSHSRHLLHAEGPSGDQDSSRSSTGGKSKLPWMQQSPSMRQRMLLLLLSVVLPYVFERMQLYIHRRYTALLAVLQQRTMRAQVLQRMQQQQQQQRERLRPQQQLQQQEQQQQRPPQLASSAQQHQQQQQHLQPRQQLSGQHLSSGQQVSPFSQQSTQQQQEKCSWELHSSADRRSGSSCASQHNLLDGSRNVRDCRRERRDSDSSGRAETRVDCCPHVARPTDAITATSAAESMCSSSQTCSCSSLAPACGAVVPTSASAALPLATRASASASQGSEPGQSAQRRTFLLSKEEGRVLLLYKVSQSAELLAHVAQLLQTLHFLATGRYRRLSEWLLSLSMELIDPSLHRSITLELLQQQLAWQAVVQVLHMILPQLPHQQSVLRVLLACILKLRSEATGRAAQARTWCIEFLQQQARSHMPEQQQRQQQQPPQQQHQQQGRRHLSQSQQYEGHSEGDRLQERQGGIQAVADTEEQREQHAQGNMQYCQSPVHYEAAAKILQQQQEHRRAGCRLGDYKAHENSQVAERWIRLRKRGASRMNGRRAETQIQEVRDEVCRQRSEHCAGRPHQQFHIRTKNLLDTIKKRIWHRHADLRSQVIRRSCLLLLRILQPRTPPAFRLNAAPPTSAGVAVAATAAAPATAMVEVSAAARGHQSVSACAAIAADQELSTGPIHTLRRQGNSTEGHAVSRTDVVHERRRDAYRAASATSREDTAATCWASSQQATTIPRGMMRRDTRQERHARTTRDTKGKRTGERRGHGWEGERDAEAAGEKVIEKETQGISERIQYLRGTQHVEEERRGWSPATDSRGEWQTALRQDQEQLQKQRQKQQLEQGQQQEGSGETADEETKENEEKLGCVFCGREEISLAFRSSNCSHRFCYYCVAAHPLFQQRPTRQQASAAAAAETDRKRREGDASFSSSARVAENAGGHLRREPRAVPGRPAVASDAKEFERTVLTGRRGRHTRSKSGSKSPADRKRSEPERARRGRSNRSSSCHREEKPRVGWLAYFGITLEEETSEDTLRCPTCGAVIEAIQWAV